MRCYDRRPLVLLSFRRSSPCSLTPPTASRASGSSGPRRGDRHDLRDLTVAIRFEGRLRRILHRRRQRDVLPTDTMKNTVYALAAQSADCTTPRPFGLSLARHFLERNPRLRRVRVDLTEQPGGGFRSAAASTARRSCGRGPEARTARVQSDRERQHGRRRRQRPADPEVVATRRSPAFRATSTRRCPNRTIACSRHR